jgi:hypothetical protein
MKSVLEDSLARECPVSVPEIAAQNGYANAGCIMLEFPRPLPGHRPETAQLKKAEIDGKGEILKAALEEDSPLTAEEMAERLGFGCPGVLRRDFPAQYQALLEKRAAYEEAQRKQLRSDLISASRESGADRSRCMSAAWYIYQPGLLPAWGLGTRHCGQTFKRAC